MNEYPEWLVDRVAAAIYESPSTVEPEYEPKPWPPNHPDDAQTMRDYAVATLDALGFAPYGGPSYWRSDIQWEAK